MQRSHSLSNCSTTRRVIKPEPKFSKFNPEEDEDSDDDSFEAFNNETNNNNMRQPRNISSVVTQPSTYNSRVAIKRRPRGVSQMGSLSNLTAVAETPPTPCAVSHLGSSVGTLHNESRNLQQQQPLWLPPSVLLSTPCGTIQEEDRCMTSTNTQSRREYLWTRRLSLQAQPQPLSVHGFSGSWWWRRTADMRSHSDLRSIASASDKFLKRRGQSVMVANRMSSEDIRSASMTQRKMSLSPSAFVEMDNSQVFVRPSLTSPSTNMHVNQGLITNPRAGRVIIFCLLLAIYCLVFTILSAIMVFSIRVGNLIFLTILKFWILKFQTFYIFIF